MAGEKDARLAPKVGQLQPFIAVYPPECVGQLASAPQAKAACEGVGLKLATVLNAAEQEAVMAFGHTVWIGYRCVDHR